MKDSSRSRHLVAPELLAHLQSFPEFDMNLEALPLMREGVMNMERATLPAELEAIVCEEQRVPGLNGAPDVRVLVYKPARAAAEVRPAYLDIHGGGYVLGAPELNEAAHRAIVASMGCVVVAVGYRLAPETRYPGSLEDCYAALRWLHAKAEALGVDSSRIAIGGESAGGGHAAALAIYARDLAEVPICMQLLDAPMLDDRTGSSVDLHPYCGEFVWTPERNRFGWSSLLGMEPGGPDSPKGAAPARVGELAGLPPAFIVVGALDMFLEEDLEYARRLIRAGVPTELHVIPGAYHGFSQAGAENPQVQLATDLRDAALARAFGIRLGSQSELVVQSRRYAEGGAHSITL